MQLPATSGIIKLVVVGKAGRSWLIVTLKYSDPKKSGLIAVFSHYA